MMQCSLLDRYQDLGETCCLIFWVEYGGGSTFLRCVGTYLSINLFGIIVQKSVILIVIAMSTSYPTYNNSKYSALVDEIDFV
jgi:hypothetical protein